MANTSSCPPPPPPPSTASEYIGLAMFLFVLICFVSGEYLSVTYYVSPRLTMLHVTKAAFHTSTIIPFVYFAFLWYVTLISWFITKK